MTDDARRLFVIFSTLITLIVSVHFLTIKQYLHAGNDREASAVIMFRTGKIPKDPSHRTSNSSSIVSVSVERSLAITPMTSNTTGSLRILYIITSLAEYNTGKRATKSGSDRLQETLIPVMREGVLSMIEFGYEVDVFLVCHWILLPERLSLIRQALPPAAKFDYWDDATPLGYKLEVPDKHVQHITRALARQHRFVIKDKFLDYDFFVAFEDDMLVKGELVSQNLKVSQELARLEKLAPVEYALNMTSQRDLRGIFHGQLTKTQLRRMMPGLIRVEVLLDESTYPAQKSTGPIPVDLQFGNLSGEVHPKYCCRVRAETASSQLPMSPQPSKLFLWETGIKALGIRKMPEESTLDWVVLQRGPSAEKPEEVVGEYWAGRNNEFGKEPRPPASKGMYINNMGGWMASRAQIWRWHTEICPGGFLPPYDPPHYNFDGEDLRNVEYWSGGLHLVTRLNACNLQRIIPIQPEEFSKHLIYHTANNKQRQLWRKREMCFSKANTLLGQLNTVRKRAEQVYLNATRRVL
jgi:hypothetical protein